MAERGSPRRELWRGYRSNYETTQSSGRFTEVTTAVARSTFQNPIPLTKAKRTCAFFLEPFATGVEGPEQAQGQAADAHSDIFSLGAVRCFGVLLGQIDSSHNAIRNPSGSRNWTPVSPAKWSVSQCVASRTACGRSLQGWKNGDRHEIPQSIPSCSHTVHRAEIRACHHFSESTYFRHGLLRIRIQRFKSARIRGEGLRHLLRLDKPAKTLGHAQQMTALREPEITNLFIIANDQWSTRQKGRTGSNGVYFRIRPDCDRAGRRACCSRQPRGGASVAVRSEMVEHTDPLFIGCTLIANT